LRVPSVVGVISFQHWPEISQNPAAAAFAGDYQNTQPLYRCGQARRRHSCLVARAG
jgi:hypothetical protein